MAPKIFISKSKKSIKTNRASIKPENQKIIWNLSDEYINSSLNQLHFSVFSSESKLNNILESKKPTSAFANKFMGSKWMESLEHDERKHVLKICEYFLNVFVKAPHWFRYLETLDIEGVLEEILQIGLHFGFGSNLNKLLGIDFSKPQVIDNSIVSFKTVQKIISSVPCCQFEMPNKSGKLTRGPEFFEPLFFKMLNIYVRCLICAIRKLFVFRVNGNQIIKWDPRSEKTSLFKNPVTLPTTLPKPDDILYRIWVEEYFVKNGIRIDIRHIARSSRLSSWISRMLVKKPDFKTLFNSTFQFSTNYLLCEKSKNYFMDILKQTRFNLLRLVRSGEFQAIARKIMNGCSGQISMVNNERLQEMHGRLGEIMVAIGRKVLKFGENQILSEELEIFVRNITYSRNIVLDEINCWDLFESFNKTIENELTMVLKYSEEFEKSLLLAKMTFSRFVVWVCIQILRSVVRVTMSEERMASFEYDAHMEFEEEEENVLPGSSTLTEKPRLKILDATFLNIKKPRLEGFLEKNLDSLMCENADLRGDCENIFKKM